MKIKLIAIGTRMGAWITTGFQTYTKRLPNTWQIQLIEIPLTSRHKNSNIPALIQQEGKAMLNAVTANDRVIALDVKGQAWDTHLLAQHLQQWHDNSESLALLIGGPDGLAAACLERAQHRWSLSALTLPHPLVRIIVAEQIYRAWSILNHHPYHRD